MVLVVFEQKNEIIGKTEIRVNQSSHEFVVKQWIEDFADEIDSTPVAGNFYGVSVFCILAFIPRHLNYAKKFVSVYFRQCSNEFSSSWVKKY